MKPAYAWLAGMGITGAILALWYKRAYADVNPGGSDNSPEDSSQDAPDTEPDTAPAENPNYPHCVTCTAYWPYYATEHGNAKQRMMEGGITDRRGKPIITLEQHLADPATFPYVTVSGDDAIFDYGQVVQIEAWPNAIFKVCDTGGHFRGEGKVYRVPGCEPFDIAVDGPSSIKGVTHTNANW